VSLDGRGSGQSDSVGCEPRHCASKDTLSEPDLAHVCKCVLGRQQEIQWPKKEEYQQLLDKYKAKEVGTVKLLKTRESDILIRPSQQEVFTAESHPPPSGQYTRVVQETTKFKIREYKEGDVVWMWDTKKGEPTNVKGSTQFWLGPFKVGRKSVDDSYDLSTLEGRRCPLLVNEHLLKPHQGGGT
jgi:hypothetical protein